MIENLKPLYNRLLAPAGHIFVKWRVKPDYLTVAGVMLFAVAGWQIAAGHWYRAAAFVTLGSFMDGLDGLVARTAGRKTLFGAVFDSTCDRLTEIIWFAGILAYYVRTPPAAGRDAAIYLCFSGITGALMVSYVKARAEGAGMSCRQGILQRPERIILLGLCLLAGPRRFLGGIPVMVWGLGLFTALSYGTMVQRLAVVCKKGKGRDPSAGSGPL